MDADTHTLLSQNEDETRRSITTGDFNIRVHLP
jgi:hypothetical protein